MKKLNFRETPQQFFKRHSSACLEAQEWAKDFKTMGGVWKKCQRADWLIWWLKADKAISRHQLLTLVIVFAQRVLKVYERKYPDDSRPRDAIKAARSFLRSPSKKNQTIAYAAANAAADAANAAADAAAYAAANAAAYAAANAAAYAADAAADAAANAAAYAANAAAYAAAYAANAAERKWQANKVRKMFKYL